MRVEFCDVPVVLNWGVVEFCDIPVVIYRALVDVVGAVQIVCVVDAEVGVVDVVRVGRCVVLDTNRPLLLLGNPDTVLAVSVNVGFLRVEVDEFKFEVCMDESEELKAVVVDKFDTVEFETGPFPLVGRAELN